MFVFLNSSHLKISSPPLLHSPSSSPLPLPLLALKTFSHKTTLRHFRPLHPSTLRPPAAPSSYASSSGRFILPFFSRQRFILLFYISPADSSSDRFTGTNLRPIHRVQRFGPQTADILPLKKQTAYIELNIFLDHQFV